MFCPNPECPDVLESGHPGEYREGIASCPKCGAALVAEPPAEVVPAHAPENGPAVGTTEAEEIVQVASFNFHHDADLVVSMLQASGIDALVLADDCGGVDPRIGFASRTRVMVPARQAAAAVALLESSVDDDDPGDA